MERKEKITRMAEDGGWGYGRSEYKKGRLER